MNTPAQVPTHTTPAPALTEDRAHSEALLLGYALPAGAIDADLIQRDIAAHLRRTVEDCLHVGRALIVLKAACGHGNFMHRLKVIGLDRKVAWRFMRAARKFAAGTQQPKLLAAIGNQAKLFELLALDDEQVEELGHAGRTGALSVEDIAGMSVMRLRAAVRMVKAACAEPDDCDEEGDEADKGVVGMATPDATEGGLQPGDRIVSRHALRAGSVVKVYRDGSACIVWDDGEPQPEGMGHERVPRAGLVLAPSAPATLGRRTAYALALAKTLVRYADELEVDDLVEELEAQVRQISERRPVPGLVAARYDLFRKFWLQGGAA